MAFCAETKEILQGWLRCGTAYTSNGIVEFTKQLLAHLPNRTRIMFRGDSGFFVGNLLDLLDREKHGYVIKVKLKGLVGLLSRQQLGTRSRATRLGAMHILSSMCHVVQSPVVYGCTD